MNLLLITDSVYMQDLCWVNHYDAFCVKYICFGKYVTFDPLLIQCFRLCIESSNFGM